MPDPTDQPISTKTPVTPIRPSLSSVIGDLRLHEFHSRIFRNTRTLRVWLPPSYEGDGARYPVFYLNDGQNLFDQVTAFAGVEWQADETADRLIREHKIPPLILVGIDNAQQERMREYVPYRSLNPPLFRVHGKRYPEFLQREVIPFIERHYRTAKGPEHTGLGGSSLGALISLYCVMAAPGIYGKLLLQSPSLYISNRQLLKDARSFRDWPTRIFVGVGTSETGRPDKDKVVVEDVQRLEFLLRRAGLGAERLRVRIDEGAPHSEAAWASRFPDALAFLFGK